MNINSKRTKQRITALSLVLTLLLGGCNSEEKNDHFELIENENNVLVAMDNSYIDNDYISNYYVVEVYNKMKEKNEIYIASRSAYMIRRLDFGYNYIDVFSNIKIVDTEEEEDKEEILSFVKATNLSDYIVSFGLGQLKYTYEDMKHIYEVIKENYVYEDDNSLRKIRMFDNRI